MQPSSSAVTVIGPQAMATAAPSSWRTDADADSRSGAGSPATKAIGTSDSSGAGPPCTSAGRDNEP